jgi:peptidoglycan/LPS O-acetylase OafA/YrhL
MPDDEALDRWLRASMRTSQLAEGGLAAALMARVARQRRHRRHLIAAGLIGGLGAVIAVLIGADSAATTGALGQPANVFAFLTLAALCCVLWISTDCMATPAC